MIWLYNIENGEKILFEWIIHVNIAHGSQKKYEKTILLYILSHNIPTELKEYFKMNQACLFDCSKNV